MNKWLPLLLPAVLYIVLVFLFVFVPEVAGWSEYPSSRIIPYGLMVIGFVLGILFHQSRVSFICLFLAVVTFCLNRIYENADSGSKAETVVFLSSVYLPLIGVLFYHLGERGVMTRDGYIRFVIILSALFVIFLVPNVEDVNAAVSSTEILLFKPAAAWLKIPAMGIVILLICVPFFLYRVRFESPFLGPLILVAVIFALTGLNCEASLWSEGSQRMVLVSFMGGSAAVLGGALIEISWRNAHIDELTELPGRRAFKHHMDRLGPVFSIAMLDIDHFKKVNDRYGHDTGDHVLRYVAAFMRNYSGGRVYRYGGEEFAIVSESEDYDTFVNSLESLRESISGRKFVIRGRGRPRKLPENIETMRSKSSGASEKDIVVTVSIGVARQGKRNQSVQDVIEAADRALYRAKKDGRNRVKATR